LEVFERLVRKRVERQGLGVDADGGMEM